MTSLIMPDPNFNSYFKSVTDSLELFDWPLQSNVSCDKVQNIIKRFSNHPSIIKIKHKFKLNKKFSFQCVSEATVRKVVKSLPLDKATAGEIPINVLKNCENCFFDLTNCINEAIRNNKFRDSLKLSDITPVFDPSDKANYRPVSVLPLLSKVFEKIIYDQLYEYLENILSELLCGFPKAHSAQHALFRLIQKWLEELDSGGYVGTIFMDLSKAYDCLSHDLLIAKLEAYGLDVGSLNFLLHYLSLRRYRTKVGSSYSKWSEICRGISQGSILGPLLFNIFINDIFFFVEKSEICNFADDNTVYSCGKDLAKIKEDLICTMKNVLKWFMLNSLKANPGKFQFMVLGDKTCYKHILKINSICVQSSDDVTLLGVMIDKNLTFKKHVGNLVRKA